MSFFDKFTKYENCAPAGVLLPKIEIEDKWYKYLELDSKVENPTFLIKLCSKKFKEKGLDKKPNKQEYIDRIKKEFDIINKLGFVDYILLNWDILNWCHENGIPTGAGRGSAAGCLILFLLDVTKIDPIKYGLFFERFVSESRARKIQKNGVTYLDGSLLADVDNDIAFDRRQEVIDYISRRHPDRTGRISTLSTLSGKICIKEVGKIAGDYTEDEMNNVSDLIPSHYGKIAKLQDAIVENDYFGKWAKDNPKVFKIAKKLEGLIKNTSVHASGIAISNQKMVDICPLQTSKDNDLITCYDMNWTAELSVKFDILGLKTLSVLKDACSNAGVDLESINVEDPELYEYFQNLQCSQGLFQIEADTNLKVCQQVKPRNLDDVSAVVAIARPGALQFKDPYATYVETGEFQSQHEFFDDVLSYTGGNCLAEGSKIYNPRTGYFVNIENFHNLEVVNGIDPNNQIVSSKVSKRFDNGIKETFSVNTFTGNNLTCTLDHKLFTIDGWKPLKNINEGDFIALPKKIERKFKKRSIGVHKARVLGLLIGDGSLTSGIEVSFVNKDENLLLDFEENIEKGFFNTICNRLQQVRGVTRIITKKKKGTYHSCSDLLEWMRNIGLKSKNGGCDSSNKHIPKEIFQIKDEEIFSFLSGLWDSDGGISKHTAHYKTISRALAEDIQHLFLLLGVSVRIYGEGPFSLAVEDKDFFRNNILPLCKRKSLLKHPCSYQVTSSIGLPSSVVKRAVESSKIPKRKIARELNIGRSILRFKARTVCFKNCKKIFEYIGNPFYINLLSLNWAEVKEIKKEGFKKVYDLEVDNIHNYVANGIIVHNCLYQEQLMQMTVKVGFTLDEAEQLRRIVGKKKVDQMPAWKGKIENKIKENNLDPKIGEVLWKIAEDSANYSFNKSHSISYANLAMKTVYMKFKHPLDFHIALLKNSKTEQDSYDIIDNIQKELNLMGIKLLPPDLAKSNIDFSKEDGNIRYGLNSVKGISEKTLEAVIKFRKEDCLDPMNMFLAAKQAGLNIAVLSSLIQAGALSSISEDRMKTAFEAQLFNILTDREKRVFLSLGEKYKHSVLDIWVKEIIRGPNIGDDGKPLIKPSRQETIKKKIQPSLKIYNHNKSTPKLSNWFFEKKLLGYSYSDRLKNCMEKGYLLSGLEEIKGELKGQVFRSVGMVKESEVRRSRNNNKRFLSFTLSDEKHKVRCFLWEEGLKKIEQQGLPLPAKDDIVTIVAKVMDSDAVDVQSLSIFSTKIYMQIKDLKNNE